jgi:hypothetical protein
MYLARRFVGIIPVFFLNGQDESTLKGGLAGLTAQVLEEQRLLSVNESHGEYQKAQEVR